MFADRKDAAIQLAKALEQYKNTNALVLGIPRGGAETAFYVAIHLGAELSMLISRKLGHPDNPEYAFGAIAEDGSIYLSPHAKEELSEATINSVVEKQKLEIQRRIKMLRKGKPLPKIKGRTVILVDDGIATGATIFAAIEMCKKQQAGKIVIAAPVASPDVEERFSNKADELVILEKPEFYHAVSQVYESFYQLSDEDTIGFMEKWEKEKGTTR
ncbi:phosphoribosyltransferase [Flavihumibacter fluvii]|uniref:phosphoribosyltransferase n=1 Tax=Flavihumibacter fluvii TaxID=2838157 RepID=UPI001BDF68C2|nr:phosphoribosyltransferase [Flavihumibacter fluvii]ULQ51630.1 phosphoribosyltransferase [Flavihumibacter fluvii]